MIRSRFFLKYFVFGSLFSILFLVLAFVTATWMRELLFDEPFRSGGPSLMVEGIVKKLDPHERAEALEAGDSGARDKRLYEFFLFDGAGQQVYPPQTVAAGTATPPEVSPLPKDPIDPIAFELILAAQHSDDGSAAEGPYRAVRLAGEPPQYLVIRMKTKAPSLTDRKFIVGNLIQLVAMIAAVAMTLAIMIYSLRSRARSAENVIRELTHGNLKARFPITKMDEIGQFMFSFNKMADEIEHLIEHLRKTESARRDLLRELAHDLRTPIASLKSLLETVQDNREKLSPQKLTDLMDLAQREADYFASLVDDLLFLGRVNEPHYKAELRELNLNELIGDEIRAITHRYPVINVQFDERGRDIFYHGDQGLIRRMIRNALENAFSFARSQVSVRLNEGQNGQVELEIRDDGPGFDGSSLASFGQRKFSREIPSDRKRRISIGLGSVIMKSVVDAYRGQLNVRNLQRDDGGVTGAEVSMILPRS